MAAPTLPLVNGQSYAWVDIVVNILGNPIAGIVAIEYADEQEVVGNRGAGKFYTSVGFGPYTATAKLTLSMEEVEALTAAAPNRRLQDIPFFPIVVSYVPDSGTIVTHTLNSCKFKNNARKSKVGDTMIECELDLFVSKIDW